MSDVKHDISFSCVITNYSHMNILLLLFYLFYVHNFLLYCHYYSVMYVTVMPVSAYMPWHLCLVLSK